MLKVLEILNNMRILVIILLFCNVCVASPQKQEEAMRAAVDAALKQSGMDKKIEEFTEETIGKPIKKAILPYFGRYAPVIGAMKIVVDQKVEVKWEF